MSSLMQQLTGNFLNLGDRLHHMHRNTNGSCLVSNCTGDCLTNPPCCISRELKALGVVKFLYCFQQTQITLLDQIQELHSSAHIFLCNADNQSQVRLRQTLFRIAVTLCHPLCQFRFFIRRKQRHTTNFFQIDLDRVINGDALCGKCHFQIICHIQIVVIQRFICCSIIYDLNVQLFAAIDNRGKLIGVKIQFIQYIGNFFGCQFSVGFALFHQCINCHFFLFHSIVPPIFTHWGAAFSESISADHHLFRLSPARPDAAPGYNPAPLPLLPALPGFVLQCR
jgi:hypothetical protein